VRGERADVVGGGSGAGVEVGHGSMVRDGDGCGEMLVGWLA
jgi:hypothetical protein